MKKYYDRDIGLGGRLLKPKERETIVVEKKTKTNNTVNVLHPYRTKSGVWCFDDKDLDIIAEPFVGQINEMIDMFANGKKKIIAYISSQPIYNQTLSLTRMDDIDYEGIYKLDGTEMKGWLCPCTLNFFSEYPPKIYVKIEL